MTIVLIGGKGAVASASADDIGGKAANLARMAGLGLPIPPAFVLPVRLCAAVSAGDPNADGELADGLKQGVTFLEDVTGKRFGDRRCPLLVSVRSGAARSMPGMMDTVLNVGCGATAVQGLMRMTGNPRFAWDCRRRFIENYASIVLGLGTARFDRELAKAVADARIKDARDLDGEALERLAGSYQALVENDDWLDDPMRQLAGAARAVFGSWTSERAQTYRRLQKLDHLQGTAVTVQVMVFGNRGLSSGAGVAFSRDPSTGSAHPLVDVLFDAQGEEVVSGCRTPQTEAALASALPTVADELHGILGRLEREFGDVQDVEFTIEEGRLWILQTRAAKRTPLAALRIAIDFVHEGMIAPREALQRLHGIDLDALAHARLDAACEPVARGTGASAGVATGRVAFDSASATRLASSGEPVILMRPDISTADVAGFATAAGIVTAVGGRTAHAALVARQMGKPCVVGCGKLAVDLSARQARLGDTSIGEGEWISIDGNSGDVHLGRRPIVSQRPDADLAELDGWRRSSQQHAAVEA